VRIGRAILGIAGAAATAAFALGCGGSSKVPHAFVALDFTPNAVHAPIYDAIRRGFDRKEGVKLTIRTPGSAPDSLKLVRSGGADIGVADIQDLTLAVEKGEPFVGVGALVQRPLAALIAQANIKRPRDLAGHLVGVSGLPSDPAFLRGIVTHDGGNYLKIRQITIGFSAVLNLVQKRVDAVPAFWNDEGVTLKQRGVAINEFRADQYGAPPYPEVVLFTMRSTLQHRRGMIISALRAIRDGTNDVLANPEPATREIAQAANADLPLIRAQMKAVAPVQRPPLTLNRSIIERWGIWDWKIGILPKRPDISKTFAFHLI
jgi:NitT/TauT family transport system substrate-binding protein/putative hydroxymethylpyrimidine transport system substrate-binding protein